MFAFGIFTTQIWHDVYESCKLISYFWMMPETPCWRRADFFSVNPYTDEVEGFKPGHGITSWFRNVILCGVILPKIAIALVLWYYGCAFLLQSPSSVDLILNATALVFVLEIDEVVYENVCSDYAKNQCDLWPELKITLLDVSKMDPKSLKRRCLLFFLDYAVHMFTADIIAFTFIGRFVYCW